ncbi:MAG: ribonuclease P protein component [Culturomica sp.]|jgi:ribonuclease P protein component|nr:ribonuclease P protein component [Culturomica sp.]
MLKTLGKSERIKHTILFEELFASGESFIKYPLRIVVKKSSHTTHDVRLRFGVSVSKKKFKSAVSRNRVKRLIRESYRLNKDILISVIPEGETYDLLFIFLSDTLPVYSKIETAMIHALETLQKRLTT